MTDQLAQTEYLTTREVAAITGLSRRTLDGYRDKGGGPPYYKFARSVRYTRTDVDNWARGFRRWSMSDDGSPGAPRDRCGDAVGERVAARRDRGRPVSACQKDEGKTKTTDHAAQTEYLTADQLGAILRLSPITVWRLRHTGEGPAYHKDGRRFRYTRTDVDSWARGCRRLSTSDDGSTGPPRDRYDDAACERVAGRRGRGRPVPAFQKEQGKTKIADHPAQTEYLTIAQVASILGLRPTMLQHLRYSGEGPAYYNYGRKVRYTRIDIDSWAQGCRRLLTSDDGSAGARSIRTSGRT